METNEIQKTMAIKKPPVLRLVFILNAILMFLPFVFYYIFQTKNITIEGFDPTIMLYTGGAYILNFILMVFSILKRNLIGFRAVFVILFLISIPGQAYLGFLIAIISLLLSFTKKIKLYFKQ